ncbi:MAG: hypothetical protein MR209_00055 [Veillonellaceae bacterium]|nr:hypothetical protein [Veillonellaceae bacterium]
MCHPVALLAAQVGMQLMGQQAETKASINMYRSQEQAALANQKMSERRQEQIAEEYGREEGRMRDRMRLVAGQNAAAGGAAGLQMGGSLMDVLGASYAGYLDDKAANLRNQRNDVYNEFVQGWNYGQEAEQARAGMFNAKMAGRRAMFGTILGGLQQYHTLRSNLKRGYSGGGPGLEATTKPGNTVSNGNYTIYKQNGQLQFKNNNKPWNAGKWR